MSNVKFVIEDAIISLGGKSYGNGDVVELTQEQAERLARFGKVVKEDDALANENPVNVEVNYDKSSKEDLEKLAAERGLVVEGTGKDGGVVKTDLVEALKADDEAK